jgi:hypothetical protein
MLIQPEQLEKFCKDIINTILICLEIASKGIIFRVGRMPELRVERVTSGVRNEETGEIDWGVAEISDYNPPGKCWDDYRDEPHRALEAMGWCVEQQKSWTADNPYEDMRSVRRQLCGEIEDYYHLEPVLTRKADFYAGHPDDFIYPLSFEGKPIWEESPFVVIAAIKIHFLPETVRRGDRSTKVIKRLSRTLATELFSHHLRGKYLEAQQALARERFESCNALAHELRNTLAKLGVVFSAVNMLMGFFREEWERTIEKSLPPRRQKRLILARLNELLLMQQPHLFTQKELMKLNAALLSDQNQLANLYSLPHHGEKWLRNKIRPKWERLLQAVSTEGVSAQEVQELLKNLEDAIWAVVDDELADKAEHLPLELRKTWMTLIYTWFSAQNTAALNELLGLLKHPSLSVEHKDQLKKVLTWLQILIEVISRIEERADRMLLSLKQGSEQKAV